MTETMFTKSNETLEQAAPFARWMAKWGSICLVILPLAYIWWRILYGQTELTFAGTTNGHNTAPELVAMQLTGIYLGVLHVLRLGTVLLTFGKGRLVNEPVATTHMLKVGAGLAAVGYGATYLFWAIKLPHSGAEHHAPLIVFLMCACASLYMASKRFLYGFSVNSNIPQVALFAPNRAEHFTSVGHSESIAEVQVPSITFADVVGNADIKSRLLSAAKKIQEAGPGEKPRNGILMHGEPGNGKTIFAEALAGELGLPLLTLTNAKSTSMWVGEETQRINAVFSDAINRQPCVLFIDEIDSYIRNRERMGDFIKEDKGIVTAMLTLLVDIRKHKVLVVAATNHLESLDSAASREGRFDFKVEITCPDEVARAGLLRTGLRTHVPKIKVTTATIDSLAKRWNGFSVKRILAVTEEMPMYIDDCREQGRVVQELTFDDFMAALRRIQGSKGVRPENVKPMSELLLPKETMEALSLISSRLKDPVRVEKLGGTLPSGVLFYGPAGTGKTTVAKAMAKEVGAAFLISTGQDLMRNPSELDKLYARAKEMRPCIIFIDEADYLLKSREYSANTEGTNKLLTIMDGVNDRVRDIVWIAATNHPEQIDTALLRGGRFTEKVGFVTPDESQLYGFVDRWLKQRSIGLIGFGVGDLVDLVGVESVANVEAVLQYAVNKAISRTTGDRVDLEATDIQAGIAVVIG